MFVFAIVLMSQLVGEEPSFTLFAYQGFSLLRPCSALLNRLMSCATWNVACLCVVSNTVNIPGVDVSGCFSVTMVIRIKTKLIYTCDAVTPCNYMDGLH